MKRFMVISAMLMSLPIYATCSIDGDTVCSLPGFREKISPIYETQPAAGNDITDQPNVQLNSIQRNDVENQFRQFAPSGSDLNYNSSCQFGVCLQNRSTPLFQQPIQ